MYCIHLHLTKLKQVDAASEVVEENVLVIHESLRGIRPIRTRVEVKRVGLTAQSAYSCVASTVCWLMNNELEIERM
jgi:hypothetical protein